jgi:hypothetical protein
LGRKNGRRLVLIINTKEDLHAHRLAISAMEVYVTVHLKELTPMARKGGVSLLHPIHLLSV